jgi:hypothetical protein
MGKHSRYFMQFRPEPVINNAGLDGTSVLNSNIKAKSRVKILILHISRQTFILKPEFHLHVYSTECPRKSAHTWNIFVEKINRARRVQFSPHETATQNPPPPFSISLLFDLSSLCCSHNMHPVFKFPETEACSQSCALDTTSIVRKTLTVPLSFGENRTFLALYFLSKNV